MAFILAVSGLITALVLGCIGWRLTDIREDRRAWHELAEVAGAPGEAFDMAMVESLPQPARRYLCYAIRPGKPLRTVVEIEMNGELGLGTKDSPKYAPMQAKQILAPPHGLVWRLNSGAISGSDGATPRTSWTRFWLFAVVPIVRAGGEVNHQRSAFGRVVAESTFWAPAALLPGEHVRWQTIDEQTARAIVQFGEFEQAVDITVAANGQPTRVAIQRWSNANAEKEYRLQSFGGYLSEFQEFDGYMLPTRVEGGNLIGTDDYFPFYKAVVTSIRFVDKEAR